MYNSQNWERWVNRELLQQLAAKDKIELPKGEATERYDRNFHMTHGRIILPHDHGLLHDAECRIRNARNVRKNTDRNVLKKKLKGLEHDLEKERKARLDLESKSQRVAVDKAEMQTSNNREPAVNGTA